MRILLLFFLLVVIITPASAQGITYITLKQEKANNATLPVVVTGVVDDRQDKNTIGAINYGAGRRDRLALKNGVAQSFTAFLVPDNRGDKSKQQVVVHVQNMAVDIKKSGSIWQVTATLEVAFYVAGKKTIGYTGKAQGTVVSDPAGYVEKFLRQTLNADVVRFATWWKTNKDEVVTDSRVTVNVTVAKTSDKPNCIAYAQRRLAISDFAGPVQGQDLELAETLSGIAVRYTAETRKSHTVLDIVITPYFDRSRSWMKERGKNPRVLAHEQAHFDITAIKACELAQVLRNTKFTEDNYEKLIDALQKKNADDANAEEDRYDNETNHGIIEEKQLRWEKQVAEQIKTIGCY